MLKKNKLFSFLYISPEDSIKLKQLFVITLYWTIMVRIAILQDFFGIYGLELQETSKFYNTLRESLIAATGAGFSIGILTGVLELFVLFKKFQNKKFVTLITYKTIVYITSIVLVTIITIAIYKLVNTNLGIFEILVAIKATLFNQAFYTILSTGLMLSVGINLLLIMQNKIGLSNFYPMLLGRYRKPREESRIFLFLDLKSSTFYAEKLGHEKYSLLLQSCFRDLADLVPRFNGEIYQFVGDEAVITWKTKRKYSYANSLLLFNSFLETLKDKSDFYKDQFGVIPVFKGAISSGQVMVAEVGGLQKTEIAYHGDVLNIASRLLELCKKLSTNLLISNSVYQNLYEMKTYFKILDIGKNKIRGKNAEQRLYSVEIG